MAFKFKLPILPINISVSKVQPSGKIINKTYDKVFVIGYNKTGTTTLKRVLNLWGFKIGDQRVASMMIEDYASKRYDRIFNLVKTADAFQDVPFSYPNLYKELDEEFPNSKFILSIRNNENQWYNSLLKFHSKKVGRTPPRVEDLANVNNIYKGWLLDVFKLVHDYPNTPLYDKSDLTKRYLNHNEDVETYFKDRPNDFLKMNISNSNDFLNLVNFLNIKTNMKEFPWMNKT